MHVAPAKLFQPTEKTLLLPSAWIHPLSNRDMEFWGLDLSTLSHTGRNPLEIGKQVTPTFVGFPSMYFCTGAQRNSLERLVSRLCTYMTSFLLQ